MANSEGGSSTERHFGLVRLAARKAWRARGRGRGVWRDSSCRGRPNQRVARLGCVAFAGVTIGCAGPTAWRCSPSAAFPSSIASSLCVSQIASCRPPRRLTTGARDGSGDGVGDGKPPWTKTESERAPTPGASSAERVAATRALSLGQGRQAGCRGVGAGPGRSRSRPGWARPQR